MLAEETRSIIHMNRTKSRHTVSTFLVEFSILDLHLTFLTLKGGGCGREAATWAHPSGLESLISCSLVF